MSPVTLTPAELEAARRPGRLLWSVDQLEAKALDIRSSIILSKVKRDTVLELLPPPRNPPARRKARGATT